jgi:hypothetical protein
MLFEIVADCAAFTTNAEFMILNAEDRVMSAPRLNC